MDMLCWTTSHATRTYFICCFVISRLVGLNFIRIVYLLLNDWVQNLGLLSFVDRNYVLFAIEVA
jgi:hypothetical protein